MAEPRPQRPRRHRRCWSGRSRIGCGTAHHLAAMAPAPTAPLFWSAYVGVVGLSSPLGFRPLALVALCGISVVFATLRVDGTVRDRWLLLRGERRLIGLIAIAGLLACRHQHSDRRSPRGPTPDATTRRRTPPPCSTRSRQPIALRALDPVDRPARDHGRRRRFRRITSRPMADGSARRIRRPALDADAHAPPDREHARPGDRADRQRRRSPSSTTTSASSRSPGSPVSVDTARRDGP